AGGQPHRELPADHLDRVWPDTDPAVECLVAASEARRHIDAAGTAMAAVSTRSRTVPTQYPKTLFTQLMKRHGALAKLYKFVMFTQKDSLYSQDWNA
ncbi:hypothetical protein ACIA03_28660, partial [Nocardioides sp. NPDC051685]|uniref:hypothetical protein n=1 Tax=Nocardioides sp. NPDC051685 TaxID=3364334 RepID=UPI0037AE772C